MEKYFVPCWLSRQKCSVRPDKSSNWPWEGLPVLIFIKLSNLLVDPLFLIVVELVRLTFIEWTNQNNQTELLKAIG